MHSISLTWTALWALALGPAVAIAQVSAPAAASAASAPRPAKPTPRLLTPAESRDSATAPGELRPERPVTPQVSIPLGRKPPPTTNPPPRGKAASAGGINDAAARCEAQSDPQARAKCAARPASGVRSR